MKFQPHSKFSMSLDVCGSVHRIFI